MNSQNSFTFGMRAIPVYVGSMAAHSANLRQATTHRSVRARNYSPCRGPRELARWPNIAQLPACSRCGWGDNDATVQSTHGHIGRKDQKQESTWAAQT